MVKRLIFALLSTALTLSLGMPVHASEATGSIRITLDTFDQAVTNGTVTLYRVGQENDNGYRILEEFGGGLVRKDDANSPYLAQWLTQMTGDNGTTRLLDADGSAEFSKLPDGLYLLIQTEPMDGFYSFRPFLVTLPMDDSCSIQVSPLIQPIPSDEPPPTGQHPAPIFAAMALVVSGLGLAFCLDKLRKK